MDIDAGAFVDSVARKVGRCERAVLDRATRKTLRALGRQLGGVPPALHDAIPAALRPHIDAGEGLDAIGPAALYLELSDELGLRVGTALEIAQSVVSELGALMPDGPRAHLRELLPPAWAAFVVDPESRASIGIGRGSSGDQEHSLAAGRPGGSRPLSDARLPSGQADSVAVSDDPHGNRLASARELRDSRQTLAAGRPGSTHPVSSSD